MFDLSQVAKKKRNTANEVKQKSTATPLKFVIKLKYPTQMFYQNDDGLRINQVLGSIDCGIMLELEKKKLFFFYLPTEDITITNTKSKKKMNLIFLFSFLHHGNSLWMKLMLIFSHFPKVNSINTKSYVVKIVHKLKKKE